MSSIWKKYTIGVLLSCFSLVAAGCGSDSSPAPASSAVLKGYSTAVSGKALKGAVKSGVVELWSVSSSGGEGVMLGTAEISNDGSGSYTVPSKTKSGSVIVKIIGKAGATYFDEVTKTDKVFGATDSFRAIVPDLSKVTASSSIAVTPLTEVATQAVKTLAAAGGLSAADIAASIASVNTDTAKRFGVTDLLAPPKALNDPSATDADKSYVSMLTLVSQIVNDAKATTGGASSLMNAINNVLMQAVSSDPAVRAQFSSAIVTAATNLPAAVAATLPAATLTAIKTNVTTAATTDVPTTPIKVTPTADTTAPTVPTGLAASKAENTTVVLTWTASTDAVGVTGYTVFRDGKSLGDVTTGTTFTDTVDVAKAYSYTVLAFDAAGNKSAQSDALSVTTKDTIVPTAPTDVKGASKNSDTGLVVTLTWTASTDNKAVTGYRVFRDGVQVGDDTTKLTFDDTNGLAFNKTYAYTVKAFDAAKNVSDASTEVKVDTGPNLRVTISGSL